MADLIGPYRPDFEQAGAYRSVAGTPLCPLFLITAVMRTTGFNDCVFNVMQSPGRSVISRD